MASNSEPKSTDILHELSQRIKTAINDSNGDRKERFLPDPDLHSILNKEHLIELCYQLLLLYADQDAKKELLGQEANASDYDYTGFDNDSIAGVDKSCVLPHSRKIVEEPARLSLLALFLYDRRETLLKTFTTWLFVGTSYPADRVLPFSQNSQPLRLLPEDDHEFVLSNQHMFKAHIIRELDYQVLPAFTVKPFKRMKWIGSGSSGAVCQVQVAAGHWQYQRPENRQTSTKDVVIAMKQFQARPDEAQKATSAQRDYENERIVLGRLRDRASGNRSILLDLGGLEEITPLGRVQSLFFELANCDLNAFLNSREWSDRFMGESIVLARAVDILEALAFLHDQIHCLHLDIKPDNILVFIKERNPEEFGLSSNQESMRVMEWKITDFNLSQKEIRRTKNHLYIERSSLSYESTVPSARESGLYQAPEIQSRDESPASERSDVWSMGCVILEILAFLQKGSRGVEELREHAHVEFEGDSVRQLYYLTKDETGKESAVSWPEPVSRPISYLDGFMPKASIIRDGLWATIHPSVMNWSESIFNDAQEPGKQLLRKAFRILFGEVLVIDRNERSNAAKFYESFSDIIEEYMKAKHPNEDGIRNYEVLTDEQCYLVESPQIVDDNPSHSDLCTAISAKDASRVAELLDKNADPNEPCNACNEYQRYLIRHVFHLQADPTRNRILEVLLRPRNNFATEETQIMIPDNDLSLLEIACQESGDADALELLFRYRGQEYPMNGECERIFRKCEDSLNSKSVQVFKRHMRSWKRHQRRTWFIRIFRT